MDESARTREATSRSRSRDGGGVQAIDRAISILQVVAARRDVGVTVVAQELGLAKSTVSRMLSALELRGLVESSPTTTGYRIGAGTLQLAAAATRPPDLVQATHPLCLELADELGETVNLVVLEGHRAVSVDQVLGGAGVTTVNWVGRRDRLHATSAGKVFLAHLPEAERDDILEEPLPALTPHTVTDPDRLRAELAEVRERGYASTYEEQEVGLVAVSAPVRRLDGTVVAAVAVSGPTFRLPPARLPEIAEQVVRVARLASERQGLPKRG